LPDVRSFLHISKIRIPKNSLDFRELIVEVRDKNFLINDLKRRLAGRLLISNDRVSFLGEYAQKVGGNFLSKSQGARRDFSAPRKARALFHAKGWRDYSPLRSFSTFYNHSNSCLTDILCRLLPQSSLTNLQATQITKFGAIT
jgi:hypothetical protein